MRCGITEDEEVASARAKLRATLEQHVTDPEERAWVEPRLAHLLGLEEGVSGDQENLFSAWRVLFERLADSRSRRARLRGHAMGGRGAARLPRLPARLVAEPPDLRALARPARVGEKHPSWGAGKRAVTSLYLEPLPRPAMESLLAGLVPGLPEELRNQILERAEGVPLYAVETVRMLLDRGLLAHDGNAFRPDRRRSRRWRCPRRCTPSSPRGSTGSPPRNGAWSRAPSVLGKTFTKQGIAALTGLSESELDALLASLAAQGGALDPGRSALARARPVLVPPGHRQARRLRDALAGASARRSTWPPRVPRDGCGARRRTRSSRSSPRTTSTPAGGARGRRRGRDQGHGARDADPRRRARLVARGERRGAACTSSVRSSSTDDARRPGRAARARRDRGDRGAPGRGRAAPLRGCDRALRGRRGRRTPAARVSARRAELMWERGKLERCGREPGALLRGSLRGRAGRGARRARGAARTVHVLRGRSRRRDGADRDRARPGRGAAAARGLLPGAEHEGDHALPREGRLQEAIVLVRHALEVALEAGQAVGGAARLQQPGRHPGRRRTGTRRRTSCSPRGSRFARRLGNRQWERRCSGRSTPASRSAGGTRRLERRGRTDRRRGAGRRAARAFRDDLLASSRSTSIAVRSTRRSERLAHVAELESSADIQEREAYAAANAACCWRRGRPLRRSRSPASGWTCALRSPGSAPST